MRSLILMLIFLIALAGKGSAGTKTILFTHASTGQRVWTDSMLNVECSGGTPIFHLEKTYLYRYLANGVFVIVDSIPAVGLEGLPDSFVVDRSGSYYPADKNDAGIACPPPGGPIYVQVDSAVTNVEIDFSRDPIVERKLFNVRGEFVRKGTQQSYLLQGPRLASGVYFEVRTHRSNRQSVYKFSIVK